LRVALDVETGILTCGGGGKSAIGLTSFEIGFEGATVCMREFLWETRGDGRGFTEICFLSKGEKLTFLGLIVVDAAAVEAAVRAFAEDFSISWYTVKSGSISKEEYMCFVFAY
jgi:hypothetical protein